MKQFGLSVVIALIIYCLTFLVIKIFPEIGYEIFALLYLLIFAGLISFYFLSTYFALGLSIVSFILNFVFWVAEQVNIEERFHDTSLYQDDSFKIVVVILGALLWTTNKLLLDKLFILFKAKPKVTNRLNKLLKIKNPIRL